MGDSSYESLFGTLVVDPLAERVDEQGIRCESGTVPAAVTGLFRARSILSIAIVSISSPGPPRDEEE